MGSRAGLDGRKISSPPGFFLNCVLIGTYVTESKVYSCSLLVSLWYTLHNVTASRDESLREWEMLLSMMYGAILSLFVQF